MMEHKAFLFRYRAFEHELRPILQGALQTGKVESLVAFVEARRELLSDPNTGDPLSDSWRQLLETDDVHQCGDVALTGYYDPAVDEGLGSAWTEAQRAIGGLLGERAVLGVALCSGGTCFDPGKMGSYFQSEADVEAHLKALEEERRLPAAGALMALLRKAKLQGVGLYVTF